MSLPDLSELKELTADGKIFGVKFIKRTDGKMRTMSCRRGVLPSETKTGWERSWDPDDKGLLQVWDCNKRGYRMIPVEAIKELRIRGTRRAA